MNAIRQRAWETAMGMRGYAGSPAQKEDLDKKKFKRTLTCGHMIVATFKKNTHYCESCRSRRSPIAGADEELSVAASKP